MRQGKVRYFGVSNYRAWRVAEICNICDRLGIDRPVASQPYYNAMNRMPEVEHFPACHYYGLGIVSYSPLARGVLTGKYSVDATPDKDSRAGRKDTRMMQTEWRPESIKLAQEIRAHAEAKGITAGQFAVSWVLNSSFVSAVIAGPRTEEQWDDYLRALEYRFTAEDEALIDRQVLATPVMILMMENAALNAIRPYLEAGESAVGTAINVRHLAATPVGHSVRAQAEVTKVEGKRIEFKVSARDEREEIGNGTHQRMLIDLRSFNERLAAKSK
jgi:predicted thioesterase